MPNISKNKNGGVITFDQDDFINGFAPQGGRGSSTYKIGPGFAEASSFDPYKDYGYWQQGALAQNPTNNNLVTASIIAYAVKSSSIIYLLSSDAKFYELNYTAVFSLTSSATFPHTISHGAHTGVVGQDMIVYKHNVGGNPVFSAFTSFYDNTDWDIGRFDMSSTFDDDFMSTVPASPLSGTDLTDGQGVPHPMCIGADDVLYVGSGRYLHGYDGAEGANGTFYPKLVTLPQGFIITSLLKTTQFLLIGGVYTGSGGVSEIYNGQAFVYPWNYLDQDISTVYDCEDNYLASMFMYGGVPSIITKGAVSNRGAVRLKSLSGDRFVTKAELPTFNAPINKGVDVVNDVAYINCLGTIFSIGNPFKQDAYPVNSLGACSAATASGFFKNLVFTSVSNASFFSSGGAEVSRLFTVASNSANFTSLTVEPPFDNLQQGRVTQIVVYFKNAVANARGFNLNLYTDGGALSTTVINNLTSVTGSPIKKYHVDYQGNPLPQFKSLALNMTVIGGSGTSAIKVSRVEVYYENVNYDS